MEIEIEEPETYFEECDICEGTGVAKGFNDCYGVEGEWPCDYCEDGYKLVIEEAI